MDHEIDEQEPSSTEGGEMNYKAGDKVWVRSTVVHNSDSSEYMELDYNGHEIIAHKSDCRPVEPNQDDHPVDFKVGDRVVSWSGRQGVVEAINEIEGFPITVRHSMREQVSYKLGGVKHDDGPVEPSSFPETPNSPSDAINPSHYKQGPIECIEAIKAATGDGFIGYVCGNVLKYLWRWPKKGGVDDLKKARWYLDRLIKEVGE
jgi:hypothetical protein